MTVSSVASEGGRSSKVEDRRRLHGCCNREWFVSTWRRVGCEPGGVHRGRTASTAATPRGAGRLRQHLTAERTASSYRRWQHDNQSMVNDAHHYTDSEWLCPLLLLLRLCGVSQQVRTADQVRAFVSDCRYPTGQKQSLAATAAAAAAAAAAANAADLLIASIFISARHCYERMSEGDCLSALCRAEAGGAVRCGCDRADHRPELPQAWHGQCCTLTRDSATGLLQEKLLRAPQQLLHSNCCSEHSAGTHDSVELLPGRLLRVHPRGRLVDICRHAGRSNTLSSHMYISPSRIALLSHDRSPENPKNLNRPPHMRALITGRDQRGRREHR